MGGEGTIRFAGQSVILHYRLKLTLASYRNQDIGQVAICSKTLWQICVAKFLFRAVWQNCVAEQCSRAVQRNCVAEKCKCSRTVWRILLSESVWCPWQPASQQPPPQQDAISAFPVFFLLFSTFPSFSYVAFITSFLRSHSDQQSSLSYLVFFGCHDIEMCLCWY